MILTFLAATVLSPKVLSLEDAVELAQGNNPSVVAARAELKAAESSRQVAWGRRLPQIYAVGWGTQSQLGGLVPASLAGMPPVLISAPNGAFYQGALMLSIPLLTGGSLDAGVRGASAQVEAARGELAEMRGEAGMKAAEAYLKVLSARSLVEAEKSRVEAAALAVSNSKSQLDAGKGIAATVSRAEAELAEAHRAETSASNEAEKAWLEVKAVTGLGFDLDLETTSKLAETSDDRNLDDWIALSRRDRGSLRAARARVRAADSDVRSAEGELRPQLYGTAMSELTSRSDMRSNQTVGLTVSVPLVNASMRSDVSRMRAMRDRAKAALRESELATEKEVRQAWIDLSTARSNAASASKSVEAAQSAYDVVALRVQAGKAILVEQLDALQALQRAKSDLRMALFDHEMARVRLQRAAGQVPGREGSR